jgi:spectinomycin phosphotransferase
VKSVPFVRLAGVREEPADPARPRIAAVLADRWRIEVEEIAYLPVGGGGHHWRVRAADGTRWFVTANSLAGRGHWVETDVEAIYARTEAAYEVARRLDRRFVLAAVPDRGDRVVHRLSSRWALSVYPFLDAAGGRADGWEQRLQTCVAGYLGELHAYPAPAGAPRWSVELPQRDHLIRALTDRGMPAQAGPHTEPTRQLLTSRRAQILDRLHRYDQLVDDLLAEPEPWVLTHGEPHQGNTLHAADGTIYLIDWDSLAVAPRERDLWQVLTEPTGPAWESYIREYGDNRPPRAGVNELFHLWWRLAETGSYVRRFHDPHPGDADDTAAWQTLHHLWTDPAPQQSSG